MKLREPSRSSGNSAARKVTSLVGIGLGDGVDADLKSKQGRRNEMADVPTVLQLVLGDSHTLLVVPASAPRALKSSTLRCVHLACGAHGPGVQVAPCSIVQLRV